MSDEKKSAAALWTELEKYDFIMQVVDLVRPVPWKQLNLPAGRTQKACQVMLDKEKSKWRKSKAEIEGETTTIAAAATAAESATPFTSKGKKRALKAGAEPEAEGDDSAPKIKKVKSISKKKKKEEEKIVKAGADESMEGSPSEVEAGAGTQTAEIKSDGKVEPEGEDAPGA